jgi:transcriptional regulator with XRE-family HTH domain
LNPFEDEFGFLDQDHPRTPWGTLVPCRFPATAASLRKIFPKFEFSEVRENFPTVRIFNSKRTEREDSMENHGLIIRQLRKRAGLTIHAAAKKLDRSVGWLSEVENGRGAARLTEREFERIVDALDGAKHRALFRIWVANHKNRARAAKTFDGAVLKFIRVKKELGLIEAAQETGLSVGYLSKIETGAKPVTVEMRNRILAAYGYSPSSWKNLATDPVRSKAVPLRYKLEILLSGLSERQIETVFDFVQSVTQPQAQDSSFNQN